MFKCSILFDCRCSSVEYYLLSGLLMGIVKGTIFLPGEGGRGCGTA